MRFLWPLSCLVVPAIDWHLFEGQWHLVQHSWLAKATFASDKMWGGPYGTGEPNMTSIYRERAWEVASHLWLTRLHI